MNQLEKLTRDVKEMVTGNPDASVVIIQACQEGLKIYAQYQKDKREALGYNVVNLLLSKYKPKTLGFMIDIAYFQFPNGPEGHAPIAVEWWEKFIEVCRNTKIHKDWIYDIKGYGEWWKNIVEPHL